MRLKHLALAVRDRRRSRRFYETYFGFGDGPATEYDDGTVIIRDADGFDLAINEHHGPAPMSGFAHFGFTCADASEVNALFQRVTGDGVMVIEHCDEPGFASFKCLDPDGYVVEAYWEDYSNTPDH
ncbi:VOC family protein [Rhizohabitans arisaemae]|uniref:VOC family protein n=1 Tax=Rhizohabitans arisaemae TaxID=2720610 RepID=UPI0024B07284|nr:VOC family protein [Rhizohabitans arisaemae]